MNDLISREAAIEAVHKEFDECLVLDESGETIAYEVERVLDELPSAQSEHTCVNCGRTANNGGWYADGGTRCPIEEHYALPKDGYCHLWEKRKDWEDGYVKRAEEGENRWTTR